MFSGRTLGNMKRPMNSMSVGPLLHFLCYETTSLIGSKLCAIPWWSVRRSVSSWTEAVADALCASKASPHGVH